MANTRGVNDDLDAHNDAGAAVELLPAWFAARMLGTRGSYGFLLATGDVVRVSRVTAIHVSSSGSILIDVLLDHAGVPDGVDMAWRTKHFLGVPVPAANLATLNLVQIVMVIEFKAAQIAETAESAESQTSDAVGIDRPVVADAVPPQDVERVAPSSRQAAARPPANPERFIQRPFGRAASERD